MNEIFSRNFMVQLAYYGCAFSVKNKETPNNNVKSTYIKEVQTI